MSDKQTANCVDSRTDEERRNAPTYETTTASIGGGELKSSRVDFLESVYLSKCCFRKIRSTNSLGNGEEMFCTFCNQKSDYLHPADIEDFFKNELDNLCKGKRTKDDVLFQISKLIN